MTALVLVAALVLADRVQAQFPAAPLDRNARLIELVKKENALRLQERDQWAKEIILSTIETVEYAIDTLQSVKGLYDPALIKELEESLRALNVRLKAIEDREKKR